MEDRVKFVPQCKLDSWRCFDLTTSATNSGLSIRQAPIPSFTAQRYTHRFIIFNLSSSFCLWTTKVELAPVGSHNLDQCLLHGLQQAQHNQQSDEPENVVAKQIQELEWWRFSAQGEKCTGQMDGGPDWQQIGQWLDYPWGGWWTHPVVPAKQFKNVKTMQF